MKNIGFVLLAFLVLTFSCTDRDDDVDTINIRIKNDSNIKSGEEYFVFQPIDFVGEMELPIGFYTYKLSVNEEGEVGLEFIVD